MKYTIRGLRVLDDIRLSYRIPTITGLPTVTGQLVTAKWQLQTMHILCTIYVDQEYTYRKATDGCVVESYLVKYVGGAETERKLMYTDTYKAKSEIIYVGTVERTEEGQ